MSKRSPGSRVQQVPPPILRAYATEFNPMLLKPQQEGDQQLISLGVGSGDLKLDVRIPLEVLPKLIESLQALHDQAVPSIVRPSAAETGKVTQLHRGKK